MTHWRLGDRFDPVARRLADRHYSRKTVGSPQFAPPGRLLVLTTPEAFWVTVSQDYSTRWPGAWICSAFRNEGPVLSSRLVAEAVAITRWKWPDAPADPGFVTLIDADKTRRKRDPGRCFRRAGFEPTGETSNGCVVLELCHARLSYFAPVEPVGAQLGLFSPPARTANA